MPTYTSKKKSLEPFKIFKATEVLHLEPFKIFKATEVLHFGPFVTFYTGRAAKNASVTPGDFKLGEVLGFLKEYEDEAAFAGQIPYDPRSFPSNEKTWVRIPCKVFDSKGKEFPSTKRVDLASKNVASFVYDETSPNGIWFLVNVTTTIGTVIPPSLDAPGAYARSGYAAAQDQIELRTPFRLFVYGRFLESVEEGRVKFAAEMKEKEKLALANEAKKLGITVAQLRKQEAEKVHKMEEVKLLEVKLQLFNDLKTAVSDIETAIANLEANKPGPESVKALKNIASTFSTVANKYERTRKAIAAWSKLDFSKNRSSKKE